MCGYIHLPSLIPSFYAAPSATVNNVNVEVGFQNVTNLVRLSWDAIPEDQWNGRPLGYHVSHKWLIKKGRGGEGRGGQHSFTRVINGWSRKEGRGGRSNPKEGVCPEGMKSVKHFILCVSHWASSKLEWYYCGTLLHLKLQLMINEVACAAYPWSGVSGIFRLSFPSA